MYGNVAAYGGNSELPRIDSGVYATNLIESLRKAGRTVLDVAETVAQHQGIKPECVLLESIGGQEADFILAQAETCTRATSCTGTADCYP